jgi:hypothetical protein
LTSAERPLSRTLRKRSPLAVLGGAAASSRAWTYIGCTLLALLASYLLGKDMNWDTLDYHFYAGFSALHDRFGMDYFPAGSQSYFNPYIYVPFYLLAGSRLPAVVDASILAVVQSGILWLTYELALQVAPTDDGRSRIAIAACSALLAFANPIVVNLFGSSYADVLTAELVLGGWLLLVAAVRTQSAQRVLWAGLLLGAASALKLTNSVHALSALVLLLFFPVRWPRRARYMAVFGAALAVSFALICLPWSIRLEQQFGNPFFPLLNGIFRSAQFPAARMLDYRFIPDSLSDALWRPFAIVKPLFMVDDEQQSPDLRYAVLLVAAILLLGRWAWGRYRHPRPVAVPESQSGRAPGGHARALTALGTAFAVDWALWLTASGNGRYFIAMACVAGVLAIVLIWQLITTPKIRAYALSLLLGAQLLQLYLGTTYRSHIPWDGGPWFEVRMPANLPQAPALYLSYGVQSNSFIVPFLPSGSGFINIAGDYPLRAGGANGAAVAALIRKYSPRLRILARDDRPQDEHLAVVSGIAAAVDALLPFGFRPTRSGCSTIVVPNEGTQELLFQHTEFVGKAHPLKPIPDREIPGSTTGYLTSCSVVADPGAYAELARGERRAELILDRLEDACPDIFQPARPVMQYYGDGRQDIWARRYLNTNLIAWVSRGWVEFVDPVRGGPATYVGPEAAFAQKGARILCGRRDERYFARLLPAPPPGGGS